MKSKLVLRGENAENQKVLIAMELLAQENKVRILIFPDSLVTDEFYDKMRNDWREGKEIELPEGYTTEERDLTVSEDFLPEGLKVDRTDLVERKKLEWHVLVLSAKMYEQFQSELDGIKTKIEQLEVYDSMHWETLKNFWNKVQTQIKDGILSREYAKELRKVTDGLFDRMKALRKKKDEEYREVAKTNYDWFMNALDAVEKKIEEGLKISGVFDELKKLQAKFHNTQFTKELRDKVWNRIDGSFKAAKAKRYGSKANSDNSAVSRFSRRYEGLLRAIDRIEKSKARDLKDLEYENHRIRKTDGQLEAQIRQAKIKMISQNLKSKEDKLKEMYATKTQLDTKMERMKEKERLDKIRKEKEEATRLKIQEELKAKQEAMDEEAKLKLEAAAEKINQSKKEKGFFEKIKDTVEEVKDQVEDKLEAALGENEDGEKGFFAKIKDKVEEVKDKVEDKLEPYTEKGEEMVDQLKSKAEKLGGKMVEAADAAKDAVLDKTKELRKDATALKDELEDNLEDASDDLVNAADAAKDAVEDKTKDIREDVSAIKDELEDNLEDASDDLVNAADAAKDAVEDKADELFDDKKNA
jgi:hypothetical protein